MIPISSKCSGIDGAGFGNFPLGTRAGSRRLLRLPRYFRCVSVGCQLEFDFPNGFQGSRGPPEGVIRRSWNDAPDPADLLGSVVLLKLL